MHVFVVSILGQTLIHLLIALFIWNSTKKGSLTRRLFIGVVAFLYLLFIAIWSIRSLLSLDQISALIRLFNNYYIFLVLLMVYSFLPIAIITVLEWFKLIKRRRAKAMRSVAFIIFVPITLVLCIWGHSNTINPKTQHYEIELPHHGAERDLKIALITDIHIGEIIRQKNIEHLVRMVQAEQPDYVFLGGDIIDYYFNQVEAQPEITNALKELHPDPNRLIIALGNHEYYVDTEVKKGWLRSIGTLMVDSVAHLQDSLYLIVRDDANNEGRLPLKALCAKIPEGGTTIVLEHQPGSTQESADNHIHLALHGHTHAGQFVPFNWAVAAEFPIHYGYAQKEDTQFVVSSGYGVAGSTFRVGTHSEIVMLHLKLRQP